MPSYQCQSTTIVESDDDIFRVNAQAIVNPVNLVGVMGKGLAKEVKLRYPFAFEHYKRQCDRHNFRIGQVLTSYIPGTDYFRTGKTEMIIHFPTKQHWRDPSDYAFIESGLIALAQCTISERLYSIAIPPLGCGLGGLDSQQVKNLIIDLYLPKVVKYLKQLVLLRF